MAALITDSDVRAVIETSITEAQMTAYINSAVALTDSVYVNVTINSSLVKEIQRWLTAHLISITRDRQAKEEGAGSAYIKYTGSFSGEGLSSTSYGQQALALDITGTLAALTTNKMVTFFAVTQIY